jgi:hypothetical protein
VLQTNKSPEWVQSTAERRISFELRVLLPFVSVYWLDFFVLTCLLFYVLEFVYIATLAE